MLVNISDISYFWAKRDEFWFIQLMQYLVKNDNSPLKNAKISRLQHEVEWDSLFINWDGTLEHSEASEDGWRSASTASMSGNLVTLKLRLGLELAATCSALVTIPLLAIHLGLLDWYLLVIHGLVLAVVHHPWNELSVTRSNWIWYYDYISPALYIVSANVRILQRVNSSGSNTCTYLEKNCLRVSSKKKSKKSKLSISSQMKRTI